ncbi:MAG: hypothetical protein K2N87_18980 [Eubacterium sp.]|nr:hypothetical protein [Eubacterium sp.]
MRNLFRIFSLLLPAMLLSACSLAVPDGGEDKEEDRMIGAYITQEVIDVEQFSDEDLPDFQNRLYASIVKNGSEDSSDWSISFPGSEGIRFFAPFWTAPDGHSYRDNVVDAKIGERDFSVSESDEEETIGLSGTIYVLPYGKPEKEFHFYVNPVYQTPDEEFYALPGSGYLLQTGGEAVEGEQVSATLSGEISQTVDGKTKVKRTNVTVRFQTMYRPVKIALCQMDAEHQMLKKQAYKPEEVPDTFHAQAETAYILVETEKESPAGEKEVFREICENTQESEGVLESFCAAKDGTLIKRDTKVVWGMK